MIIECINCNKKFNVNAELIPTNGRNIQCGSCAKIWHYKIEKNISEPLIYNETNNLKEKILKNDETFNFISKKESESKKILIDKKQSNKIENEINFNAIKKNKNKNSSNFFSYLVVFVISIIALFILIDTFNSLLIRLFPSIEIIIFNFFETLKDIKLFIINLIL